MTATAALLIVALLVGHDLGDFSPFSTPAIQRAKAIGRPMGPIALHAAIHAALVAVAVTAVVRPPPEVIAAAAGLELGTHFVIDLSRGRLAARMGPLGDMRSDLFWWSLGIDQLLHGLVLVGIAWFVLA